MTSAVLGVPPLLSGLCDDAAVFPPGNLPLDQAVPAHLRHRAAPHAPLVGVFVVAAGMLDRLAPLVAHLPAGSFEVAVTVPAPDAVADVLAATDLAATDGAPALRVRALEVAVPQGVGAEDVVPQVERALSARPDVDVFVELPRDGRRPALIGALSAIRYLAKLRTGGVTADLYPDPAELAAAVVALTRAGVPFKATAGLHHAVRNTDPVTGFDQHGFLNVLAAVDAALSGADEAQVAAVLDLRAGDEVAALARAAGPRTAAVRHQFRSLGTCSITEPLDDLTALELVDLPGEPAR